MAATRAVDVRPFRGSFHKPIEPAFPHARAQDLSPRSAAHFGQAFPIGEHVDEDG
jgi:hypothetical protein